MKTLKSLLLTPSILAVTLVLLPASARADAKGGATRQLSLARSHIQSAAVANKPATTLTAMTCSKCTDSKAVVAEATFKAAQPVSKHVVATHGCEACTTKMVSAGHGKMAATKLAHSCEMEPKGCCATD